VLGFVRYLKVKLVFVVNNKLRLFVYGKVIAGHIDPIEKKPVTHYRPGTDIFSIATTVVIGFVNIVRIMISPKDVK
jgi:hypothetical protein